MGKKMKKNDIGLIGLGVMGENLIMNIESRGYSVSVFNRTYEKTEKFINGSAKNRKITGFKTLEKFVESIEKPRKIMLMVKAGEAVDKTLEALFPLVDQGDILIDGGNSLFSDTIRRTRQVEDKGFLYIGTGVSGGEEGALKGPSIMPGGSQDAYKSIQPVFEAIAAKVNDEPCCSYIGPNGAGHFVKMVHNGIEYGDMQLIAESYFLMKNLLGMTNEEMCEVFTEWNTEELDSYLIGITREILKKKDPESGEYVLDIILDKAGQKGTGKWTSQTALNLGVSAPTIAEAVFARCISAVKQERIHASGILKGPEKQILSVSKKEMIHAISEALYASKICSYAQGFALMREAGEEYGWKLDFGKIAMIWRGGCIIRAQFLEKIKQAYDKDSHLKNLLLDDYFLKGAESRMKSWRLVVSEAVKNGIPIPGFTSALTYYDSYRSPVLWANMIQAQRDYFGAHTYERTDRPGIFHTEWLL